MEKTLKINKPLQLQNFAEKLLHPVEEEIDTKGNFVGC